MIKGTWDPSQERVMFGGEPVKVVVSGLHAPIHQVKSLCLVTLGTKGGSGLMNMWTSRGTIGEAKNKEIVIVDVAEEDEIDFIKRIGDISEELVVNWTGPVRSSAAREG
jgi:hypothetical protein